MTGIVPIGERPPGPHIVSVNSKENAMRQDANNTNETPNGKTVAGGFYMNRKTWDLVTVNGKKGILPTKDVYVKIPVVVMLVGAPVIGATLVMFLPFAGIALFLHAIYRKVVPAPAAVPGPAPARIG
jgi:hypothetical protein